MPARPLLLVASLAAGASDWPGSLLGRTGVRIVLVEPGPVVVVTGLAPDVIRDLKARPPTASKWTALLRVVVAPADVADVPPAILGDYRVADDGLRFEPRFPIRPGVRYRAVLDRTRLPGAKADATELVAYLEVPAPKLAATTVVAQVYPSADRLPENHFRFYLHFSAPMRRGEVYRHLRLLKEDGTAVEGPFLELEEELWDPDGKRFTLLFDPARVKRGLVPREEEGPVLEEGKRFTLVVEKTLRDANGQPLKEAYRKTFAVGPPLDVGLSTKEWKIEPPAAAAPLRVRFPRPLDHALLHRMFAARDPSGADMAGAVRVDGNETIWEFTPQRPWTAGEYKLAIDASLEDPCGNRIGKPFEVDVFKQVERGIEKKTVELPFRVAAP